MKSTTLDPLTFEGLWSERFPSLASRTPGARVYDIAKFLGRPSKEVVQYAQGLGLRVLSPSTYLPLICAEMIAQNLCTHVHRTSSEVGLLSDGCKMMQCNQCKSTWESHRVSYGCTNKEAI